MSGEGAAERAAAVLATDACICAPDGSQCLGVRGDHDDQPDACAACLALDPDDFCLHDPEIYGVCDHDWLDRPESDTHECLNCGAEGNGFAPAGGYQ